MQCNICLKTTITFSNTNNLILKGADPKTVANLDFFYVFELVIVCAGSTLRD